MPKRLLYMLLAMIFIIGCAAKEEEPEEEDAPPPPPPPTPEEIAAKISNDLKLDGPIPGPDVRIEAGEAQRLLQIAQQQNVQLSATEDGKRSLQIVSQKVDARIRACFTNEAWSHVFAYTELHLVFQPDSVKFLAERNRSIAELKKPQVTVKMILNDPTSRRQIAHLEMFLPLENKTVNETMKIGDQLYGLKFVDVVGNNKGVLFEYAETDDTFEVLMKAAQE